MAELYKEADAGDGTQRKDQILTGYKWALCSFSVLLCMFLVALDQLITAAVMTTIANKFHQFNKVTWVTAAFMLPLGCLSQFWGRVSISFGRKWTMLFGVIFFEIGSLIAALANTMDMFIGGRAIQGIGASAVQTCAIIILTEITSMDRKPFVFALFGSTFAVASAIGPIIGGILGSYASWRWCFYINVICGAIIVPLFVFTYNPKPPQMTFKEKASSINYLDNFLLVAASVLVLLAVSFGQTDKWNSSSAISCFVIGGVLYIVFFWYNFTQSQHPCIPRDIATSIPIFTSVGCLTFVFSAFMVVIQFLSVYLQNVLGHNAFHTGLGLLAEAISTSFAGIISGVGVQKTSCIKPFAVSGGFFITLSSGLFLLFNAKENIGHIIGFEILSGIGMGQIVQSTMMGAIVQAPQTPGSSILTATYITFWSRLAAALFSEVGDAIYSNRLAVGVGRIAPHVQDHSIPLQEVITQTSLLRRLNPHGRTLVLGEMMHSVRCVYYLAVALAAVGFIFSLCMSNRRLPKKEEVEQ